MYICDFVVDISIPPICILTQKLCLSFKNKSLSLRSTWKKLQKPLVTKNFSVGFNHYAEVPYKK